MSLSSKTTPNKANIFAAFISEVTPKHCTLIKTKITQKERINRQFNSMKKVRNKTGNATISLNFRN